MNREQTINKAVTPSIVRYTTTSNHGIEPRRMTRHCIGYVVRGEKYIYDADRSLHATRGDMFFLEEGYHHIEDVVERGSTYEQVEVYIDTETLHNIISNFATRYNMPIKNRHSCTNCYRADSVVMRGWNNTRNFFCNLNNYLRDEEFTHDQAGETIKLSELIYLILTNEDSCLKNKILSCIDSSKASFQHVIHSHVLDVASVESLASECNRSLTSFKKEFKRLFDMPPHQWYLRQRLNHSRLLLISTSLSVAEIGEESTFPNTSHFIKLFKKFYGLTPSIYRHRYLVGDLAPQPEAV